MEMDYVFTKIMKDLVTIKVNPLILSRLQDYMVLLKAKNIKIIDSFSQIKKNPSYPGLEVESMFYDEKHIYDIVVGVDNLETNYILLNDITSLGLLIIPKYTTIKSNETQKEQIVSYEAEFQIFYQENVKLYYRSTIERYDDLLRILDGISKLI